MSDTLRFLRSQLSDSPLAGLDRVVAAAPPAMTARTTGAGASLPPLTTLNPNLLSFSGAKLAKDVRAPSYEQLAEKDHEVLRLKREVQELADGKRQLAKALAARDAKIGSLEKSSSAAARRSSHLGAQLQAARAELDRTRHRALTAHRQQERRIATLEQTLGRKLGLSRPQACVPHEFFVNPLTGRPEGSVGGNPLCATVLKASTAAQIRVEAMVGESLRLEALCEALERTFGLDGAGARPDVLARLEAAVAAAVELLDAVVRRLEDLAYEAGDGAPDERESSSDGGSTSTSTSSGPSSLSKASRRRSSLSKASI